MTWHVWTDGSCQHGVANVPKRLPGWGGWAAIVEHGSDGLVLRGRQPKTTNVRMELHAATEGLRPVPDGAHVVLHTDCTTLLIVQDRWKDGSLDRFASPDIRWWRALAAELDRVHVEMRLIVRGNRDPIHRRAHVIAGAEARGGLRNLPPNAIPLDELGGDHRVRKGMQRQLARDSVAAARVQQHRRVREARAMLVHTPACTPGMCVPSCPVWVEHGAFVATRL